MPKLAFPDCTLQTSPTARVASVATTARNRLTHLPRAMHRLCGRTEAEHIKLVVARGRQHLR